MTADKMFEELGYEKCTDEVAGLIDYTQDVGYMIYHTTFFLYNKAYSTDTVGMKTNKAIQIKLKELGWIE